MARIPSTPLLNEFPPFKIICGTDEAGRGPLCGAVVAAAVILPPDYFNPLLNDSKQMSEKKREKVYDDIITNAVAYAVSSVQPDEIEQLNIGRASLLAMDRSIQALPIVPDMVLVDGNIFYRSYHLPYTTVIKGDSIYTGIAAASVLAKVTHDRDILKQHELYPHYGWDKNKGYGTKRHIEALKKWGATPFHRSSFVKHLLP